MTGPSLRHFTSLTDLSADELRQVIDLAAVDSADFASPLAGQGVALIFEKPSNRTRHSMEVAVVQLGGHPVYTRGEEVGFDVREPVEDIARVMSGYHSMIAARVFDHAVIERLASASSIPVINMLSDQSHPLQALADVRTMIEEFGDLAGLKVAYVGDYNNVARSLGEACLMLGAHYRLACPPGYGVDEIELQRLRLLGPGSIEVTDSPREAVVGAVAIHTDTWVSMGQETEKAERLKIFTSFAVTEDLMARAAPNAIFMHCLPAYRGLEVSAAVIDGPASRVIRQGHNRLHTARAVLAFLLEHNRPSRRSPS